jgi:hypothetical protein
MKFIKTRVVDLSGFTLYSPVKIQITGDVPVPVPQCNMNNNNKSSAIAKL